MLSSVTSLCTVVVDRILADADYWKNLEEKLKQFYLYHFVPELLSRHIFLEKFGATTYTLHNQALFIGVLID